MINDRDKLPTFEISNGKSWIDITVNTSLNIGNWDVLADVREKR